MRTWTLERQPRESAGERVVIGDQEANWYRGGEVVELVELGPVLDLLESLYEDSRTLPEVQALLQAHGRLEGVR